MSSDFASFGIFGVLKGTFEVAVVGVVGEVFAFGEVSGDELVDEVVGAFDELVDGAGPAGIAKGMTFGGSLDGAGRAGSAK